MNPKCSTQMNVSHNTAT